MKYPFVLCYNLFDGCDVDVAERILNEHNDFILYNAEEYRKVFKTIKCHSNGEDEDALYEEVLSEKDADHFRKLFNNRDFAESSLVGFKIDYDALHKILANEFKNKVESHKSIMNDIAPYLRDIASTLVIAAKVVSALAKREDGQQYLSVVKANFEKALKFLEAGFILNMPEYTKYKERIATFKTAEGFVKMSEKVLETAEIAIKFYNGKKSDIIALGAK